MNDVTLELFHVPGAVDLEVGVHFQETSIRHEEGAASDREDDLGPFIRFEVLAEERQAIRIAFRGSSEEQGCLKGVRLAHREGVNEFQGMNLPGTGTLM
jgi:hypothetical protein